MVTIIDFETRMNAEGQPYIALILQGDVQLVLSKETGKYYATSKKVGISSTFNTETAKSLIGKQLPGVIVKESCEPYDYTNPTTGEVVQLNFHYVYKPEEPIKPSIPSMVPKPSENGILVG
jgi:hypothetical protein